MSAPPAWAGPPKTADSGARITQEQRWDPTTVDITIDTPAVVTQDPQARIYTPKGWTRHATRTWPVLYVYSGGPDTYTKWSEETDIKDYAARNDVIVVMPDSGKGGAFVNWYNRGKFGGPNWETFHTEELPQLIERNFHGSGVRAAMGISSGAEGAVTYAARRPGLFRYVASFSGVLHPTMPGIPAALVLLELAADPTRDPTLKWGNPVWDRKNWEAHDPYVLAENLRGTGLYISSGTTGLFGPLDPPWAEALKIAHGSAVQAVALYASGSISEKMVGVTDRSFTRRLEQLNIPATVHLYGDGLHQWKYWVREYHTAWPLIMKALNARPL
ncbi:MAG: alpha/beta hydrolase family protein [Streptosporangiaceae bacterium]